MSNAAIGAGGGRVLAFIDQPFWRLGPAVTTDQSFLLFLQALAPRFERLLFAGRVDPRPGSAVYPCLPNPKLDFVEIPYYPSQHAILPLLSSILRGWRAALRAVRLADLVLLGVPNVWAAILWGMGAWCGRPVILMVRQDIASRVALRPPGLRRTATVWATRLLEAGMVRLSRRTLVFTVGGAMHRRYARGGKWVQPLIISLVRESQVRSTPRRLPPAGSPLRLVWVGRLHADKGLDDLLQALRRLDGGGSAPPALDLVGNGPLEPELRRRARELGVADRVVFHGYIPYGPSLAERYERAALFVLPSETEGFPQVLPEAMASGLPVVATAVGGIPFQLRHEMEALLVPPRQPVALADAIARILADAGLYGRLSAASLGFARQHTLERETERMMRCIHEYLEGRRRR